MNKTNGGDWIPGELFQILKGDAVKVLHSIGQQIWKIQQWPQDWKKSVLITIPKKGNAKGWSNYCTIALIPHASSIIYIFKLGFSNSWTENFHMYKLGLARTETPEIKLPTSNGSSKSNRIPEKHLFLLHWLCQRLRLCGSQQTVDYSWRDGNIRAPYLPPEKPVCRTRSNS